MEPDENRVPYADPRPPPARPPLGEGQFSLLWLLGLTTVVAVALVALKMWWLPGGLGLLAWAALGVMICYSALVHRAL